MADYEVTLRFLDEGVQSEDDLWETIWKIKELCKVIDKGITACWVAPEGVKKAKIEGKGGDSRA